MLTNLTAAPFSSLIGPTSSLVIGQFLLRARRLLVQVSQHRRALAGSSAARPRAPLAQRFLAREEDADGARASSLRKDTGFKPASSLALVRSAASTESAGCASVRTTGRSAMLVLVCEAEWKMSHTKGSDSARRATHGPSMVSSWVGWLRVPKAHSGRARARTRLPFRALSARALHTLHALD